MVSSKVHHSPKWTMTSYIAAASKKPFHATSPCRCGASRPSFQNPPSYLVSSSGLSVMLSSRFGLMLLQVSRTFFPMMQQGKEIERCWIVFGPFFSGQQFGFCLVYQQKKYWLIKKSVFMQIWKCNIFFSQIHK